MNLTNLAALILGVVIVGACAAGLTLGKPDLAPAALEEQASPSPTALPSIDVAAPAEVKTATFALG